MRWFDRRSFGGAPYGVPEVGQTERGDAMFIAMASRHAAEALDLGSEILLARAGKSG
jgi:hypothetical protein